MQLDGGADEVEQLQRGHREAERIEGGVDDSRILAGVQGCQRDVEHPGQHPVDDEPGGVGGEDCRASQPGAEVERGRHCVRAGQRAGDDLQQRDDVHRVEDVEADHPLRVGQAVGQRGDRQRTGVAGEDGVGSQVRLGSREGGPFGVQVLEDRLDHQVGAGHSGGVGGGGDQASDVGGRVRRQGAALHQSFQAAARHFDAAFGALGVEVGEHHRDPGLPGDQRGQLGRHESGADHGDPVDRTCGAAGQSLRDDRLAADEALGVDAGSGDVGVEQLAELRAGLGLGGVGVLLPGAFDQAEGCVGCGAEVRSPPSRG